MVLLQNHHLRMSIGKINLQTNQINNFRIGAVWVQFMLDNSIAQLSAKKEREKENCLLTHSFVLMLQKLFCSPDFARSQLVPNFTRSFTRIQFGQNLQLKNDDVLTTFALLTPAAIAFLVSECVVIEQVATLVFLLDGVLDKVSCCLPF